MDQRHSRRWLITSTLLALVAHVMFALHYAFDLFGLVSEPQKKPITGALNVTLGELTVAATGRAEVSGTLT